MAEWPAAAHREGVIANLAAAQIIQRRTRLLLNQFRHSAHTKTPSPKGAPPAVIDGALIASIQAEHDGDDAIVGPTSSASSKNGAYGRFLELGGTHTAHNPSGEMTWLEDGRLWSMGSIDKTERPFLKPATEQAVESGDIYQTYYNHWLIAQQTVAH